MDQIQEKIKSWINLIEFNRLLDKENIKILRKEINDIETELDEGYNTDIEMVNLFNNENNIYCTLEITYPSFEIEILDINLEQEKTI